MRMKKTIATVLAGACFCMPLHASIAVASSPCAMLTFSDNTRFKQIGTADMLSELVLEKMMNSGTLNFKETKPLATNAVIQLYDEDGKMYSTINQCRATGNYDAVFEGRQFDSAFARSIDLAKEGDVVEPELIKQIGQESGVKYLIQGSIDGYSNGEGTDALAYVGLALAAIPGASLLKSLFGNSSSKELLFGVSCTLRVIDTDTGKVIWQKKGYEESSVSSVSIGNKVTVGQEDVTTKTFYAALNKVADSLANMLVEDVKQHKLPVDMGV